MPRSASTGVYTAPSNSFNPAVTNTTISATAWNATSADYVTALAHTASTTRALYPTTGQVQDGAFLWGGTAGGTADALTITLTPAITAYAAGQVFQFIAASTNATATPTINVNGVGVKTIKRQSGAAIQTGDISAGAVVQVAYNGTDFLLTGVTAGQTSSLGVVPYSGRTSNTILGGADRGYLIDITSGTFTQTFGAASGLASGWWIYLRNSGTGDITLDPNGAETIDGLTTFIMYPGEARLIQCDGTVLRTVIMQRFSRQFNASGTFTKPPGYSQFGVRAWSGGGSGDRSGSTSGSHALGGNGGGCGDFTILASTVGTTATVTIGAGGTALSGTGLGNPGGNTTLGSLFTVFGATQTIGGTILSGLISGIGSGGNRESAVGFEAAAQANTTTALSASSIYGGSASITSAGDDSGNSVFGGAAGGSITSTSVIVRAPGTSIFGGNGGAASSASSGTAGSQPGGGGGATHTGTASGAGGAGAMRIWGLT
jgi:hypothetical protein